MAFGRIELIRMVNGKIERLRLHQESIRDKVLKVTIRFFPATPNE
jgi:hypothetical protein